MKKIYIAIQLLVVAWVVSGCASSILSENLKRSFTPIYHSPSITDYPAIGEVKTVEVGESLVYKDKQTTIPAIDIEKASEHQVENLGKKFTITILPGRYVENGNDASGRYFEAVNGKVLINGDPDHGKWGVYVADSDSTKTEIYVMSDTGKPLSYAGDGIQIAKSVHQRWDELSFKKELVYAGISHNVVSILYREFTNDMARPAFSQDIKYDLSESKTVGYRGSRFEIIKATNQGLTYRTLKQLD